MLLRAVVIAYENQGPSISDQDEGGGVACLPCTILGSGPADKQAVFESIFRREHRGP
jgi:hypothetical protein